MTSGMAQNAPDLAPAPPHVQIIDTWSKGLSQAHMVAYRLCLDAGMIRIIQVVTDLATRYTIIRYLSTVPAEWTHETLKAAMAGTVEGLEHFVELADKAQALALERAQEAYDKRQAEKAKAESQKAALSQPSSGSGTAGRTEQIRFGG